MVFHSGLLWRAAALVLCGLLAACDGDDDGASVQPLPLAAGQPTAYTESYLARHPGQAVRPGHIVLLRLEAVKDGEDDTGSEPGMDEVTYVVDAPVSVVLHADEATGRIGQVVLRDAARRELGRHRRGDAAVVTLALQPGVHYLEVHHAQKGDPAARPQTVFVRLGAAGQPAAASSAAAAPAAVLETVATASNTCHNCTFGDTTFQPGSTLLDGTDMNGSTFTNVQMAGISMRGATCLSCAFKSSNLDSSDFTTSDMSGSDFTSSNLYGLNMAYDFASATASVCQNCQFGAQVNNVHFWGAKFAGAYFQISSDLYVIDLSGTDCSGCTLFGNGRGNTNIAILHLEGTQLAKANFYWLNIADGRFGNAVLDGAHLYGVACSVCTLAKASAKGVNLLAVGFGQTDWSGADLSGSQAIGRVRLLTSGSFAGARLDHFKPANVFSSDDFKSDTQGQVIDFSGTSLAGLDLTGANFSSTAALVSTATDFSAAALTNGTTGIDLSGQKLDGLTAFAGRDLRGVRLAGTSLYQADLHGANLGGATLTGADLSYANLAGARLTGALMGVAPGSGAAATQLFGAYMPNVDLTDADLRSANLRGAHLYGDQALLVRTRLDGADLSSALLAGATFDSASLNDTVLDTAVLVNARFGNANLTNTKFGNAYLQGADFGGAASLQGISLNNAAVSTAAGSWGFTEQDGTPFTYSYGATALGAIATSTVSGVICPSSEQGPCTGSRLTPSRGGPFPAQPACVPIGPRYNNCLPPKPAS